jgi:hypothetical protein
MKSYKIIIALLFTPFITNAQLAYLNNGTEKETISAASKPKKEVAAPKFLPKNTATAFVDFDYKKSANNVDIKWKFNKSFTNKTVHLLRGVMNEDNFIKWEIIKAFGPLANNDLQFRYKDKKVVDQTTYYRIRVSEDGDNVEYTNFYRIN